MHTLTPQDGAFYRILDTKRRGYARSHWGLSGTPHTDYSNELRLKVLFLSQ